MAAPTTFPTLPPLLPARHGREGRIYGWLAILQILDVATTWTILANWTSRAEGNPVVAGLIEHSGLVLAMVALLIVKLAVVWVLYEKQTGVKLMSAIYSLVIVNNLLFLGLWLFS